ncbi:MAG: HPF/RaiA family ribosome-associated protein [Phycisphaerales bacterium]
MRLTVQGSHIKPTPSLVEHVRRKVGGSLGRLRHRVRGVSVTLDDENGPRGGVDKACRVRVALAGASGHDVVVEQRSPDLYAAIDAASKRAARAVVRVVGRERSRRRR